MIGILTDEFKPLLSILLVSYQCLNIWLAIKGRINSMVENKKPEIYGLFYNDMEYSESICSSIFF